MRQPGKRLTAPLLIPCPWSAAGGWIPPLWPGGTFGSITGEFTSNNFTSNGGRNATSNVLVDGVSATGTEQNGGIQTVLYTPSVDAVQEFNVQQNSYSAQFGSS